MVFPFIEESLIRSMSITFAQQKYTCRNIINRRAINFFGVFTGNLTHFRERENIDGILRFHYWIAKEL